MLRLEEEAEALDPEEDEGPPVMVDLDSEEEEEEQKDSSGRSSSGNGTGQGGRGRKTGRWKKSTAQSEHSPPKKAETETPEAEAWETVKQTKLDFSKLPFPTRLESLFSCVLFTVVDLC